jgi:hypothetical protein
VGRDSKEESDSGEFDHRCKCFIVVESFNLSESLWNDASFVLCDYAVRSPFEFEYLFRINNFAVRRFFNYLIEFHAMEDVNVRGQPSVSLLPLSSPALPLFICTFPIPLYHPQGPHSKADNSRIQSPTALQKSIYRFPAPPSTRTLATSDEPQTHWDWSA